MLGALTSKGISRFAECTTGRLLAVQGFVAGFAAAAVFVVFVRAWLPVLSDATQALPDRARIENGRLEWPSTAPLLLAGNRHLSIAAEAPGHSVSDSGADLQWVLRGDRVEVRWIGGFFDWVYPLTPILLDREVMEPRLGAWRTAIHALSVAATVAALFLSWWILASIYALPIGLIAFFADRKISMAGAWRLAGAALMPGALLLSGAIATYGFGRVTLPALLVVYAAHLPLGWIFIACAIRHLPRLTRETAAFSAVRSAPNPFKEEK